MLSTRLSATATPFSASARPCRRPNSARAVVWAQLSGQSGRPTEAGAAGGNGQVAPDRRAVLKALAAGLAASSLGGPARADTAANRQGEVRHTEQEWRELLSPEAYAVLREEATERRFSSPLVSEHRKGTFACAGCGSPLFASDKKYESGTGWPSFYEALPGAVDYTADNSIPFMPRTEVRCHRCQGHLGHRFVDGPPPTNLRYCMNGVALAFVPDEA